VKRSVDKSGFVDRADIDDEGGALSNQADKSLCFRSIGSQCAPQEATENRKFCAIDFASYQLARHPISFHIHQRDYNWINEQLHHHHLGDCFVLVAQSQLSESFIVSRWPAGEWKFAAVENSIFRERAFNTWTRFKKNSLANKVIFM